MLYSQIIFIVSFMVKSFDATTPNKECENLDATTDDKFKCAGIIWMERVDDVMYTKHTFIKTDSMRRQRLPEPIIIARTKKNEHDFTHFDIDINNRTLVMVDKQNHQIIALAFDDMGLQTKWTLYEGISDKVYGIAVDWTTDVVYWTDATYDVILGSSLERYNQAEVVIDRRLDEPYAIVVYPNKGYLFWSDIDEKRPRIMRADLNGRNIEELCRISRGYRAKTLAIDHRTDRLYWLRERNSGTSTIVSISIFTKHRTDIAVSDVQNPYSLDVLEDNIFYVAEQLIYEMDKTTLNSEPLLIVSGSQRHMLVVNRVKQDYPRTGGCRDFPCPGLCTKSNSTRECFCNDVKRASLDRAEQNICGPKLFSGLLIAKGNGLYTMKKNFIEYKSAAKRREKDPMLILESEYHVKAVTSDIRTMKMFFYELQSNSIKSVRTEEGTDPKVFSLAVGEIGALACDTITQNLYWTDMKHGHIMVSQEDGRFPYMLHTGLKQPMAIAVHPRPKHRMLLWSEIGRGVLCRSYLNGHQIKYMFEEQNFKFYGISIDFKTDDVYLCDRNSVYVTDLEGYRITALYQQQHMFTGLTVYHDYLVLSDTHYHSGGLHVFDKTRVLHNDIRYVGKAPVADPYHNFMQYGNWYGVSYHHTSSQPDGTDSCSLPGSHRCEQLCLPNVPRQKPPVICVCELGYVQNDTRCELALPNVPYLFVVDQMYRKLLQVHRGNENFVDIPLQQLKQPYSIVYDPVQKMVYWSDVDAKTISRATLDGSQQQIIIFDQINYFTDLILDPTTRVLYYISIEVLYYFTSINAYNIDTGRHFVILKDHHIYDPMSLTLNRENGWLFYADNGKIWRVDVDGSNLTILVDDLRITTVAVTNEYIFFGHEIQPNNFYEPVKTKIVRSYLNGTNITMVTELDSGTTNSLVIDRDFLYWTNSSTRGIQRARIEETELIENVGPVNLLFKPTDLFINILGEKYQSSCSLIQCDGICLAAPEGPVCKERIPIITIDTDTDMCRIPDIQHAEIVGNTMGNVVPDGFTLSVHCFSAHRITRSTPMVCQQGNWSHIPSCKLEYDICGETDNGYKVYKNSGLFFVYPGVKTVDVVCIGGGGGGYNNMDPAIVHSADKMAGDGGKSSFGDYLFAFGGKGGSQTDGGEGGNGHARGGPGKSPTGGCITGGTAGYSQTNRNPSEPDYSNNVFCGSGGYSFECDAESINTTEIHAGPGGQDGNTNKAGLFGGGAGSRGGGSGGGGGWSLLTATVTEKDLIRITVGEAGTPSYGQAGNGLVVVMWGNFRVNDEFVNNNDMINACVSL